jgi:hypothetical protein
MVGGLTADTADVASKTIANATVETANTRRMGHLRRVKRFGADLRASGHARTGGLHSASTPSTGRGSRAISRMGFNLETRRLIAATKVELDRAGTLWWRCRAGRPRGEAIYLAFDELPGQIRAILHRVVDDAQSSDLRMGLCL